MKFSPIKIGKINISPRHPPFIIAEMSGNHNQSLKRALKIVEAAAKCGCHALKLQTYTADTMTLNCKRKEFQVKGDNSLWGGMYLYDLYKIAYTPWEWHKEIFKKCRSLGMIGFSTAFDETAVDFLESLNVPAYKIASFENNDIPLIKKVAKTGKPLIISTGMLTLKELNLTVKTARKYGCKNLILLKCTSAYPSLPKDANLLTIPNLTKLYNCHVGLSDHTQGIGVAVASVSLGARVIEKHFTLKRSDGGVDAAFSMEPDEMKSLVEETERAFYALGKINYRPTSKEKANMQFRRSIIAIDDINKGQRFTKENIRVLRPGFGLPPVHFDQILGLKAAKRISKGTPISRRHIKK